MLAAPPARRVIPFGFLLLLVLAGGLYIAMLISVLSPNPGGGEIAYGDANVVFTIGLSGALALLILAGVSMRQMPRRHGAHSCSSACWTE